MKPEKNVAMAATVILTYKLALAGGVVYFIGNAVLDQVYVVGDTICDFSCT
jgi:hypothetical protein